jgi:hypothetical protein
MEDVSSSLGVHRQHLCMMTGYDARGELQISKGISDAIGVMRAHQILFVCSCLTLRNERKGNESQDNTDVENCDLTRERIKPNRELL